MTAEATPIPADAPGVGRTFAEFRELGLLWLINKAVFHPRGYAVAFRIAESGEVVGWELMGDGTEPWTFAPDVEDAQFAAVKALLGG